MKISILLLFILGVNLSEQDNINKLTSELNLEELAFGANIASNITVEPNILGNGTFDANFKIKNKIFEKVNYNYDQNKKLQGVTYYFRNFRSIDKNASAIYQILERLFGPANKEFKEGFENVYSFESKDFEIDLRVKYGYFAKFSGLTIRKINIIIKREYDEFSKIIYLTPQNNSLFLYTENGDELSVEFIGTIKSNEKKLLMKIGSQSKNWKFLEEIIVLTSDGETERFELSTNREVNPYVPITEERALFEIPPRLIEKINSIDDVKFRIKGVNNYDFRLGQMQFQTYLKILDALEKE
ncbi:hypothetical protein [Peijinzhouia sedimentorum]